MAYQATFQRYESKYLLTRQQKHAILQEMQPHMQLDAYGRTTIRNIYYDTPDYRLIRRSLEKPVYKEKLRIRSYQKAAPSDPVFVELKKKYQSIVYKRRLTLPEAQVMHSFQTGQPLPVQSQIAEEIAYFRTHYQKLKPSVFLSYEREAFYALDGSDFRVTFDENILYRQRDFLLCVCSALAIGWILAGFYMYRAKYTKSFVATLVLLPAVVCVVIMMVNGNVGTGVAVAGAVSAWLNGMNFGAKKQAALYKTLRITIPEDLDYTDVFVPILQEYTSNYELTQVRTTNMGSLFKLTYDITLRSAGEEKQMIDKLRCRNGNLEISISNQETNTSML